MSFIFYFLAAVTIIGALGVVLSPNVVHSALFLVLSFIGVAAIYFYRDGRIALFQTAEKGCVFHPQGFHTGRCASRVY